MLVTLELTKNGIFPVGFHRCDEGSQSAFLFFLKAHWKNTPKGMPFFSVFNYGETHESRIWLNKNLPLTVRSEDVPLPPYYPDNDVIRTDVARH